VHNTTQIHNKKMNHYNKTGKLCALFGLGITEIIPSPQLCFLRGVFVANHLASNDNLTTTAKRQHTITNTDNT